MLTWIDNLDVFISEYFSKIIENNIIYTLSITEYGYIYQYLCFGQDSTQGQFFVGVEQV